MPEIRIRAGARGYITAVRGGGQITRAFAKKTPVYARGKHKPGRSSLAVGEVRLTAQGGGRRAYRSTLLTIVTTNAGFGFIEMNLPGVAELDPRIYAHLALTSLSID